MKKIIETEKGNVEVETPAFYEFDLKKEKVYT